MLKTPSKENKQSQFSKSAPAPRSTVKSWNSSLSGCPPPLPVWRSVFRQVPGPPYTARDRLSHMQFSEALQAGRADRVGSRSLLPEEEIFLGAIHQHSKVATALPLTRQWFTRGKGPASSSPQGLRSHLRIMTRSSTLRHTRKATQ